MPGTQEEPGPWWTCHDCELPRMATEGPSDVGEERQGGDLAPWRAVMWLRLCRRCWYAAAKPLPGPEGCESARWEMERAHHQDPGLGPQGRIRGRRQKRSHGWEPQPGQSRSQAWGGREVRPDGDVMRLEGSAKPGVCPDEAKEAANCTEGCQDDGNCNGNLKCCLTACGMACQMPNAKPGNCPEMKPGIPMLGLCHNQCSMDSHCVSSFKCCTNGCGRMSCVLPVF
ncbi:uncharacterized protein LOC102371512 isoform X1 [Alligator sinensis]|uniref:Uncharacterized protein LOC102371512 isoform X1 n=1 Tax=Alligator sinensis TaxID=38654 RepID=A0A3Q0FKK4_ALLSI|nr:uncharacterized protein LOC102371512 isoform X1 [Alligator sinensis]